MSIGKSSLLALAAGLVALPALAADLNYDYNSITPAAGGAAGGGYDWNGAYVGIVGGYNFGELDTTVNGTDGRTDRDGGNAAIVGGYNAALGSNIVGGVEAEVGFGSKDSFGVAGVGGTVDTVVEGNMRGRLGYGFQNVLVYGTAGVAIAGGEVAAAGTKDTNTHVGYTLGAGIEAGLTENVTARAEYLYTNTSKEAYRVGGNTVRTDLDSHKLRVGAGYKF